MKWDRIDKAKDTLQDQEIYWIAVPESDEFDEHVAIATYRKYYAFTSNRLAFFEGIFDRQCYSLEDVAFVSLARLEDFPTFPKQKR